MTPREDFKKLYSLSFSDSAVWVDWMMQRVYADSDLMMLHDERGRAVSAMLLRRYGWKMADSRLYASYVYAACTHPMARGLGHMGQLMREAIHRAADRGDAWVCLLPADTALYYYYEQFGFAKSVYVDRQRYTALHHFPVAEGYEAVKPVYADFAALERSWGNTLLHSELDFDVVCEDILLDGGGVFAVAREGKVEAMAFAVAEPQGHVQVKALFAPGGSVSPAADAVLAQVRAQFGERMIVVDTFPVAPSNLQLMPKGMMRLTDAGAVLGAIAAANPKLKRTVRVTDPLLDCVSGYYVIEGGEFIRYPLDYVGESADELREPVTEDDEFDNGNSRNAADSGQRRLRRADLDVSSDVLTRILCSDASIGEVMGLPTAFARMPLVLD